MNSSTGDGRQAIADPMISTLSPGQWVRLASEPDWGVGQVQSVIGTRVTVNFEHAGKRLVHTDMVKLEAIQPEQHR